MQFCKSLYIDYVFINFLTYFKAGKLKHRPNKYEGSSTENGGGIGSNLRSVVILAILMILMMFAVHCTWVTSNAYSSPSIVLAFHNSQDGWVFRKIFMCYVQNSN